MLPNLVGRAADASLGWLWPSWRSKANRGQIQWITYVLPIWYLVSMWGLGPKVCMHHFGCGMNWIKRYYMIVKVKKWNLLIFNLFNGIAFLNIVILYYLLMRRDVWFANHLVEDQILNSLLQQNWLCKCVGLGQPSKSVDVDLFIWPVVKASKVRKVQIWFCVGPNVELLNIRKLTLPSFK